MEKTSYTVKVDGQSIEIDAYGTYSAAANAMRALCVTRASKVTVIAGNGERASYRNAQRDALGVLSYERKD